jgi:hypothetical protein
VPGFFWKQASRNRDQGLHYRALTATRFAFATQAIEAIALSLEQLHRFEQASCHAIEGLRQLRDLILT